MKSPLELLRQHVSGAIERGEATAIVELKVTTCRKVRLNSQGYAYSGMQYFGAGAPLYYVEFSDGRSGHVRAADRKAAIATALEKPGHWGIR